MTMSKRKAPEPTPAPERTQDMPQGTQGEGKKKVNCLEQQPRYPASFGSSAEELRNEVNVVDWNLGNSVKRRKCESIRTEPFNNETCRSSQRDPVWFSKSLVIPISKQAQFPGNQHVENIRV
jgi:hypothetical protein